MPSAPHHKNSGAYLNYVRRRKIVARGAIVFLYNIGPMLISGNISFSLFQALSLELEFLLTHACYDSSLYHI